MPSNSFGLFLAWKSQLAAHIGPTLKVKEGKPSLSPMPLSQLFVSWQLGGEEDTTHDAAPHTFLPPGEPAPHSGSLKTKCPGKERTHPS